MANGPSDIVISDLSGGFNDTDAPQDLEANECVLAENVEFFDAPCGQRRLGTTSLSLTSSGLTGEAGIAHLSQWFPTNSVTLPEYIAVAATPSTSVSVGRRDTSGVWHTLSPNDAINTSAPDIFGISTHALDENLFISCRTAQNRLHVLTTASSWRRAGLAAPAAPTAANQGSGGYTGKRYFRVRYTVMSGTTVLLRSEPSASLAFTPSGTGASVRVTKPTTISEGETHWELEASEDNANFYRIAQTLVATTTFDDTASSSKSSPAPRGAGAPVSNDGTSITYVLLSNQAAALNLTGTVSNGTYGDPAGTIAGRGWIGYTSADVFIPAFPATWTAGTKWYASPDVASALEGASSSSSGNYAAVGTLSDAIGAYLTIPSAKFLDVDGDRLIYAGHWTDATQQSTVGWTPVKSDPGVGNSERAPIVTTGGTNITTTVDLDNYDGGGLTGIAASTYGTWYAFKWQRIYSAIRTGDVTKAYDINTVSTSKGAIPGSIVKASDNNGTGAIFFLDPFVGPCRLGAGGIVNPIHGIRTTWARVNLKATSVVTSSLFYPYKQQVKWWVAVDGSNTPTLCLTVQISDLKLQQNGELRGGISTSTGLAAQAQCAASLTFTVGTFTTDYPFIGLTTPNFVQRCDTGTDDNGTAFVGTIVSRAIFLVGLLNKWRVRGATLLAESDPNGSIKVGLVRDEGLETKFTANMSLAPALAEDQVILPFDDLVLSELHCVQVKLTDGTSNKNWRANRIDLKPSLEESR